MGQVNVWFFENSKKLVEYNHIRDFVQNIDTQIKSKIVRYGLDKHDISNLNAKQYIESVELQFSKFSQDVHVVFIKHIGELKPNSQESLSKKICKHIKLKGFNLSNAMVVIYDNNHTGKSNFMPLTPWILIHRLEHMFYKEDLINFKPKFNLLDLKPYSSYFDNSEFYIDDLYIRILENFLDIKSSRTGRLDLNDIPAEMFASYIVKGSITLRKFTENELDDIIRKSCSSPKKFAYVRNVSFNIVVKNAELICEKYSEEVERFRVDTTPKVMYF